MRTKLGSIFTDTATLLIADPCKVLFSKDKERSQFTWEAYADLLDFDTQVVKIGDGAVSVKVGCDGWYPVYMESDDDGTNARLVIELGGRTKS